MTEPVRERAIVKVVQALEGMIGTRPWGGNYPSPPVVERRLRPVASIATFPHLCLLEASSSTLTIGATVGAQAMFMHDLKLTLYGYVKEDEGAPRSTWLQRLWDDVVRTLLANATLGGEARDLNFDGAFDTDEGDLGDIGAFAQDLTVLLDEALTVT